jgi:hypothetical protein
VALKKINIGKKYFRLLTFCVFTIVFILIFVAFARDGFGIFDLNEKEFSELSKLAQDGNKTAMRRLMNYYYISEIDHNKRVDFIKNYKDISPQYKKSLYAFSRACGLSDYTISFATEFANDGDYYMQRDLADFYAKGWFVEKDLQKAAYWTKISECNKKGISIKECQISKKGP